jgi:CheY-like chemotaxis protein
MAPPRILIAEDNRVMSDVLKFNLQRSGYSVETVPNGRTALERLEREQFDLLMSDYQMPEVNGEELCRAARHCRPNREIPIIMVSAKGFELDVEGLTRELRLSAILYKPFSPRQVVETVQRVLAEREVMSNS